ncbi:hypothetical protein A5784_01725 [Mycobacterium sp. 852013-50091_SCH5140682]|uniref:Tm-1-like ATP-binding domain-containing protein n=1 Tax=Mycobacterium sp. 852013-50091_SCH5140682 TaxID=1834109 RepID=UPI0007EB7252|nr:Tm-1-like ATP-binding domain-containing protein [Mycobacterium sp. 852013-50091_SCH5140682]OBC02790.1 hypothetical protein A5784_01725 [Mycobacterium sp. 852013-50091_SCH5140682]
MAAAPSIPHTVAVLCALDTKGEDADFILRCLRRHGLQTVLIDIGVLGTPHLEADISRETVAVSAGTTIAELGARHDRATAVASMADGARSVVADLAQTGLLGGVFAIGGGAGTTIGAIAMRDLPLGLPKAILSTVAAGNTASYVGTSDIVMYPSIVDFAGVNRISAITYRRAADAFVGMVLGAAEPAVDDDTVPDRPLIAASMFGVTTECVTQAKAVLEDAGCEVLVFHATGAGGRTMERLIADGHVDGVLDLTTTEWADEVVGGILTAGPQRLGAAARSGVPQVVSLGATDMVNFGPLETIPDRFTGRNFYQHNAENTLMRVNVEEARRIGRAIGAQLRNCAGPCTVLIPSAGTSALDAAGQPFDDPVARRVLQDAVTAELTNTSVRVIETAQHINDRTFAKMAARRLLDLLPAMSSVPAKD